MNKKLNIVYNDKKYNSSISEYLNIYDYDVESIMRIFKYDNYNLIRIGDFNNNEKYYYFLPEKSIKSYNLLIFNELKELLNKYKNIFLILLSSQEPETIDSLILLNNKCDIFNIPKKRIIIINNNYMLLNLKQQYNFDFKVHTTHLLSLLVKKVDIDNNFEISFILKKKDYDFFLCHNNKPREHRVALLTLLKNYNIIEDINWSLIKGELGYNEDSTIVYEVLRLLRNNINLFNNDVIYFTNIKKKCSKYEKIINYSNIKHLEWELNLNKKTYENTYFNIVTETHFSENDMVHITEKSFKPFNYYHYPLFLATHNHVKYMKENYNFDYFDDIINHSYDNYKDDSERLFKLVEEIKRIQENKDFFINFYKKNEQRFIKNRQIYLKLDTQHDISFLNSLI